MTGERLDVAGLTLADVVSGAERSGWLVLTRDGKPVAVIARPDAVGDAALAWLLESVERSGPSLSDLLAALNTTDDRPPSPPAGLS